MTLTVGYDATAAVRQSAGIGRYARELLVALSMRPDDIRYRVFACAGGETTGWLPALDPRFRYRATPVSDRAMNAMWYRARVPLPVQILTGRFDVFHSPDYSLPPLAGRPSILTVHDLAFLARPESAYPTLRAYLTRVVPGFCRRATRIIAVSQSTRSDLISLLGVEGTRITVIPEGVSNAFRPVSDEEAARATLFDLGVGSPFILSVGTVEPRKNYARLFEAYALLRNRGVRQPLIVAGRLGWLYEPILARLSALKLTPYVLLVTPNEAELVALYGMADAFVYPSLYEGFGIPPLEALACGAPMACSNSSSLPEVVGDAAIMFDPLDVEGMADAIERILSDHGLAVDLASRGLERAGQFTWARAAADTVAVYREAAHGA